MRDGLIEERERVAHRTLGRPRDRRQGLGIGLHGLGRADAGEVPDQGLGLDSAQVEALAAGQDRHRHLADLGGGEHEFRVRRRLLQRLQKGVERLLGEHVDFVDDVDLVARLRWRIADAVDDAAYVVDAGMRGGIHLQHIHVPGFHDRPTMAAEFRHRDGGAGVGMSVADIVEPARQDPGRGGLADAAHARKHPGLRDAVGREGVGQGAHHGALADQIVEILGAILASEHPVGRRGRRWLGKAGQEPGIAR
ncbi:hypothetical protein CFIICLFH_5014 [Methylobacterium goesingense]|nr:hypothetical protein CFIICLFH_5014 [Methylobacterium goesingense]